MQPYFFPYIGYFQLINAVDEFIVYDNIEFTKGGWIQRNRILQNGRDVLFSLPIKKDSDYLAIVQRRLADVYLVENRKTLRKIEAAYSKAPFFKDVFPLVQRCFLFDDNNLFRFIFNSIKEILEFLKIEAKIIISSEIKFNNNLKSEEKVLSICKALNATHYINTIGGIDLYKKENFAKEGVVLSFLRPNLVEYKQITNSFIAGLSIIDVLMHCSKEQVIQMLKCYQLE